jgi:hypothetical protein
MHFCVVAVGRVEDEKMTIMKKGARALGVATLAVLPAMLSGAATTGCEAAVEDDASQTEDAVSTDEALDAATTVLGLFQATTARVEDTDLPVQSTRIAWRAIADAVEGDGAAAKLANVAQVVESAVTLIDKAEGLEGGTVTDDAFNAYVRDLAAKGTRIKPVDTIMKGWPADTDFAALFRSATSGGTGELSIGKLLTYVRFFARNIEGSTVAKRIQVLQTLLAIKQDAERRFPAEASGGRLSEQQTETLLATAELLAGADGYINRGDAPRLLPVVPQVVSQIADKLIAEGIAQGIGQLRAQHPFIYRRWTRRPNGFIGRRVNAEIGKQLSKARAQKFQAMQQASQAAQDAWESGMGTLGVHRYSLESDGPTAYWDTGRQLTTADVDKVVRAMTGSSLSAQITLQNAASLKDGAVGKRLGKLHDVKAIAQRVDLPDGIPVKDALVLVRARLAGEDMPLPWGLTFRMTSGDRVMIRAYRAPCECRFDAAATKCVIEYTNDKTKARETQGRASAAGGASCDLQNDCFKTFSDTSAATYIPYACAYRFRHADGDAMSFYKHPSETPVLNEDPDDKLDQP